MEVFGAVAGVAGLLGSVTTVAIAINNLKERYHYAPLNVTLVAGSLWTVKAALEAIEAWRKSTKDDSETSEQLDRDLNLSLEACACLVSVIDRKLKETDLTKPSVFDRAKFVALDAIFKDFQGNLDAQIRGLQLLLQVYQCRTLTERTEKLQRRDTRRVFREVEDHTLSLNIEDTDLADAVSILSEEPSVNFEVDHILLNSPLYRKVYGDRYLRRAQRLSRAPIVSPRQSLQPEAAEDITGQDSSKRHRRKSTAAQAAQDPFFGVGPFLGVPFRGEEVEDDSSVDSEPPVKDADVSTIKGNEAERPSEDNATLHGPDATKLVSLVHPEGLDRTDQLMDPEEPTISTPTMQAGLNGLHGNKAVDRHDTQQPSDKASSEEQSSTAHEITNEVSTDPTLEDSVRPLSPTSDSDLYDVSDNETQAKMSDKKSHTEASSSESGTTGKLTTASSAKDVQSAEEDAPQQVASVAAPATTRNDELSDIREDVDETGGVLLPKADSSTGRTSVTQLAQNGEEVPVASEVTRTPTIVVPQEISRSEMSPSRLDNVIPSNSLNIDFGEEFSARLALSLAQDPSDDGPVKYPTSVGQNATDEPLLQQPIPQSTENNVSESDRTSGLSTPASPMRRSPSIRRSTSVRRKPLTPSPRGSIFSPPVPPKDVDHVVTAMSPTMGPPSPRVSTSVNDEVKSNVSSPTRAPRAPRSSFSNRPLSTYSVPPPPQVDVASKGTPPPVPKREPPPVPPPKLEPRASPAIPTVSPPPTSAPQPETNAMPPVPIISPPPPPNRPPIPTLSPTGASPTQSVAFPPMPPRPSPPVPSPDMQFTASLEPIASHSPHEVPQVIAGPIENARLSGQHYNRSRSNTANIVPVRAQFDNASSGDSATVGTNDTASVADGASILSASTSNTGRTSNDWRSAAADSYQTQLTSNLSVPTSFATMGIQDAETQARDRAKISTSLSKHGSSDSNNSKDEGPTRRLPKLKSFARLSGRFGSDRTERLKQMGEAAESGNLAELDRCLHESTVKDLQSLVPLPHDPELKTPLMRAAARGQIGCMERLVRAGAEFAATDRPGLIALHHAIMAGQIESTRWMAERFRLVAAFPGHALPPGPLEIVNARGQGSLSIAAFTGKVGLIEVLVNAGAMLEGADRQNHTPLFVAIKHKRVDAVKTLVNAGANVNHVDNQQLTPLMFAAIQDFGGAVQLLIEKGADMKAKDSNGDLAIHHAARHGNLEVVEKLYLSIDDLEVKNNIGERPLHLACGQNHLHVAQALLRIGCNPNAWTDPPTKRKRPDIPTASVPLHYACRGGHYDCASAVIMHGALVNSHLEDGTSPLILACAAGDLATVQLLLETGANVNAQRSTDHFTALHVAVAGKDSLDIVKQLLNFGANARARNKRNETPTAYALQLKNYDKDAVQFLSKHTYRIIQQELQLERRARSGQTMPSVPSTSIPGSMPSVPSHMFYNNPAGVYAPGIGYGGMGALMVADAGLADPALSGFYGGSPETEPDAPPPAYHTLPPRTDRSKTQERMNRTG